jgi:hypothetical protein
MPNADIWLAEHDAQCLQKHMDHLKALNVRAVSGDQGDNATLARWLEETGCTRGELFDVIIVSSKAWGAVASSKDAFTSGHAIRGLSS